MYLKHSLFFIFLYRDFLLPLPQQLILNQLLNLRDILPGTILALILQRLILSNEQLVLPATNAVHELLILHQLVDALQYHVDVLDVHC